MKSQQNTPSIIHSLNELVTALSEGERTTYNRIIRSMKIPIRTYDDHCSWSDKSYTRNCIADNENFELILLCWEAEQMTPIHDHGGEECWVTVIQGEFKETIYQLNDHDEPEELKSSNFKANEVSYMRDFMGFHSLENLSSQRSMSLHLYAKPIRNCNMYDEESEELINKELDYTTISELEIS